MSGIQSASISRGRDPTPNASTCNASESPASSNGPTGLSSIVCVEERAHEFTLRSRAVASRSVACVGTILAERLTMRSSVSDLVLCHYNPTVSVQLGSSRLLESGRLKGRRVGIVSNPASVDARFTHIVDALMQSPGRHARRDLRSAARIPIRRAGQHDRDAARQRLPPQGAGVLALQRNARADRGHAAARRRDGDRSPGHRRAHLHLHLHDGELPARLREARRRHHRVRSARIRSAASTSKGRCSCRATSRSSDSSRSRCVTA